MRGSFCPGMYSGPAGVTLATIQTIVNAQTFGRIWIAQGGAYSDAGVTPAADGALTVQVNDRSNFGANLSNGSAGSQLTYRASFNGFPALQAVRTNDHINSAVALSTGTYYRISAWRPVTHTTAWAIILGETGSAAKNLLQHQSNTGTYSIYNGTLLGGITIADGTDVVTTELFNGASSSLQIDKNAPVTGNAGAVSVPAGFSVFSDSAGENTSLNNVWHGTIIVPTTVTPTELGKIQTFLASLQGRTI